MKKKLIMKNKYQGVNTKLYMSLYFIGVGLNG